MLVAEPSLAVHVSQANLRCDFLAWSAGAGSGWADHVSTFSSLTKLVLPIKHSVLEQAGMLDALRQLSGLQSLACLGDDLQTLLVNSVSRSWSLLTKLKLRNSYFTLDPLDWSLQQCPQLQALAMNNAVPLCLTALTSLTCQVWCPQDRDCFQCSRLGDLHVLAYKANLNLLPSTLTSLSLHMIPAWGPSPSVVDDHLRSPQSLVHMCLKSYVCQPSNIGELLPVSHPAQSSVTSVELHVHPRVFSPPDMDSSMAGQHVHHLGAWFPHLQCVHIHLRVHGRQPEEVALISAAWFPAHCRLVVFHKLTCPVRIVKCPSGRLSIPLSSRPIDR